MKKIGAFSGGLINGLLGTGGGLVLVPLLRKSGSTAARAQATSVAIMLPICVVSAVLYRRAGLFAWADAMPYIPGGLLGAWVGARLLPKIPADLLQRIFALTMIWAAVRLFR